MLDGFKPIDRVREYGNQTEKVETSEFPNEPKIVFIGSDIMADARKIKLDIIEKAEAIAKEIAKGNDVYITKSASGVVIKKMTVGKV